MRSEGLHITVLDWVAPLFDYDGTDKRQCAIILLGRDDGQFQSLRAQFMDAVQLPEGGKQPPTIIHSSLARFIAPKIELSPVEEYAQANPIKLTQSVSEFRLVETRREPMQDFTVLEAFKLS